MESTNPHAVPRHAPSPVHEPWKTPSRSLPAKGRPGPRLVAGGGLGSTSSRLGWAEPTEMQWWGSSGGMRGKSLQQGPLVPEKVQGLGTRARKGINLLLLIFVTEWKVL